MGRSGRQSGPRVALALVMSVLLLATAVPGAGAAVPGVDKVHVLVTFKARPGAAARELVKAQRGEIRREFRTIPTLAVALPERAVEALRRNPMVAAVEPDAKITAFDHGPDTGDFEYENAWGVEHIGAKVVHDIDANDDDVPDIRGNGVKVAVIDTGLDYIHDDPDDSPYVVDPEWQPGDNYAGGIDLFNNDPDPMDDNGHGTHVAGILSAQKNGYLVAGVAPEVELYAVKVLDSAGNGEYSNLIAGIEWARAQDVDVINMSLGAHVNTDALRLAIEGAAADGIVLVAASGNVVTLVELFQGCPVAYPAAYPQVLSTTFTNPNNALTGFSCTGPEVDFASPGDQVYSPVPIGPCANCSPQGYLPLSGTSMASPHLAGTAALLIDAGLADSGSPGLTDDIRDALCDTADPGWGVQSAFGSTQITPSDPRYPNWFGCGVIDADGAVLSVVPPPPPPPGNDPPVANADDVAGVEDTAQDIDVLANDTDPDGDPLTVTTVTDPPKGTASINPDGSVHYVPDADASGDDGFDYTISDGNGGSDTASVTIHVAATPDAPVAADDSASTDEDTAVNVAVVANDTDADGDTLSTQSVTDPPNGSAAIEADGSVTYTPDANWSGVDTFSYTAADGTGGTDTAVVTVTVAAVNDAPSAAPKTTSTVSPNPVTVTLTGSDLETCNLTFEIVQGPLNGSLGAIGNVACTSGAPSTDSATVTYTPDPGFAGNEQFTYRTSDGSAVSATVAVAITVAPAPVANPMHVGDLDGSTSVSGKNWTARVTIRIDTGTHAARSGAIVTGSWSNGGTSSCTTNSSGTCTVQKTKLARASVASVTFTVTSVTLSGWTYTPAANHDPDGSSNGTSITVLRPS